MSNEEQTREEVLRNLSAQSEMLLTLSEDAVTTMRAVTVMSAGLMYLIDGVRAIAAQSGVKLASMDDIMAKVATLREADAPAKIEDTLGEPPPAIKKARAKKATPQPEPLGPPLTNPAEMNDVTPEPVKTMADIKPTKPGKTLADLRVALQDCITKHGMPGAKERLAPFAKVSDVPDAEIDATIKRLLA